MTTALPAAVGAGRGEAPADSGGPPADPVVARAPGGSP
ncbi:hypothetical protein OHA_1_00382 [Pleomorphomonas sp. SM30]|uniref:Uncharacterized protein n=1 Tax=Oharaeibacter diazotrophicus TaxID=1920512 RepID=A0A4R6RL82_9HYPH|nr:hypothetical protein EDD54_1131 [Oharaeibacter diazotrophicus]BBE70815.1 hypothetical protein OHA_1_00382 [Pleomorphomonas sp. SM30]